MSKKQKVSARGTFVFDKDDIEELDEMSLTSIMVEIKPGIRTDRQSREQTAEPRKPLKPDEQALSNATINALLEDLMPAAPAGRGDPDAIEQNSPGAHSSDALLDADQLFPDAEDEDA